MGLILRGKQLLTPLVAPADNFQAILVSRKEVQVIAIVHCRYAYTFETCVKAKEPRIPGGMCRRGGTMNLLLGFLQRTHHVSLHGTRNSELPRRPFIEIITDSRNEYVGDFQSIYEYGNFLLIRILSLIVARCQLP